LCLILGWTFFSECLYLIAPTAYLLTDFIYEVKQDEEFPWFKLYIVPLLCALAVGLLLIALTYVCNLYNASRFTSWIRWASSGCLLFSISSVVLLGDPLMMPRRGYPRELSDIGDNFDIAMIGSLAGWIVGALFAVFAWRLRRKNRYAEVRHDSPFQPLDAEWVPEALPTLGNPRRSAGG